MNLRHSGRILSSSTGDDYPRVCTTSDGFGRAYSYEKFGQFGTTCWKYLLPTVGYRVESTVPKTVTLRYTDRFLSISTGDDYPRVCITSEGLGRA